MEYSFLIFTLFHTSLLMSFLANCPAILAFPKESGVGYGFDCNETFSCDGSKSLTCVHGACQCIQQETMLYEQETSSCLVLTQKPCITEDTFKNLSNFHEYSCVQHAHCDRNSKICVCDENFMGSDGGSCIPKKLFSEWCTVSSDCRQDLGLICVSNVCVCNSSISIYEKNETFNGCVGQVKNPCIQGMCTKNARCVSKSETDTLIVNNGGLESNNSIIQPEQSSSSSKICSCNDGYFPTPSGSCAKDYGISCDEFHACKPWLRCGEGGTCECLNPISHENNNSAKCISKVREPCNANSTELDFEISACVFGAECVADSSNKYNNSSLSPYHRCLCKEGFEENDKGGCDLGFGSKCKNDSASSLNAPCSASKNLECIDGTCECKRPFYQYDEKIKECVGRDGTPCKLALRINASDINENTLNNQTTKTVGCVEGAKCETLKKEENDIAYIENQDFMEGICKCILGKNEKDGSCGNGSPAPKAEYIIATASVVLGIGIIGTSCYAYFKRQGYLIDALTK